MRNRGLLVAVAVGVCLLAGAARSGYAQSVNVGKGLEGTWKLDVARSNFGKAPAAKSATIWITSAKANSEKWKLTRLNADGTTMNLSYSGAADGKFSAITGDPDGTMFAFLKDGSWEVQSKDGKSLESGKTALSADGKTITFTTVRHSADGDDNTSQVYTKSK